MNLYLPVKIGDVTSLIEIKTESSRKLTSEKRIVSPVTEVEAVKFVIDHCFATR